MTGTPSPYPLALDSTEPKKIPCEEDEYYAKYLKDLKGHKLAQHEGVKSSYNQCYIYDKDAEVESPDYVDEHIIE